MMYPYRDWIIATALAVAFTVVLLLSVWWINERDKKKRVEGLREVGRFKPWNEISAALARGEGTILLGLHEMWWTPEVMEREECLGKRPIESAEQIPSAFLTDGPRRFLRVDSLYVQFPRARLIELPVWASFDHGSDSNTVPRVKWKRGGPAAV